MCAINCGLINRLQNNEIYRKKFKLTLAACLSYVMLGWVVLQYGTALPDLMVLIGVDLEAASWLFTVRSIGFVAGSILFGILYDIYNRVLIMCVCSVGMAVCTLLAPYLLWYPVAVAVRICTGIFCGGVDTGCNTIVASIWGSEGGPYMQALYFAYSIGGIVAPVLTEPFMASKGFSTLALVDNKINHDLSTTRTTGPNIGIDYFDNVTSISPTTVDSNENSKIHFSFIITAVAALLSCIPYVIMLFRGGFDMKPPTKESNGPEHETMQLNEADNESTSASIKEETKEVKNDVEALKLTVTKSTTENNVHYYETKQLHEEETESNPLSIEIEIVKRKPLTRYRAGGVVFCIALVNLLYGGAEECLGAYIVTFCLDYLDWSNAHSATLNSLYWVTSFVGGLSGIVLVQIMPTTKLLYLAHFVWIATFVGALFGSLYFKDILIWICVPASGFFMVQIVPATFSWIEENVCDITGKISAIIIVFTGVGLSVNPLVVGYMMQLFSYVCFMYILVGEAIVSLMLYIIAHVIK